MADKELAELREEVARLRERVAVLENRLSMPVIDGHPVWRPSPARPCEPPFTITCGGTP